VAEKDKEAVNLASTPDSSPQNESEEVSAPTGEIEIEEVISQTKVLRQGPWMHPFPLITGISITALLATLFFANVLINRYSEELSKTDYFHAPPNLAQLIIDIQKSTMVIQCGKSQGSGWVISLGEVVDTADAETKKLDKEYPGSVVTNFHVIEDCVDNKKGILTSNGFKEYESVLFSYDEENDLAIVSTKLVLPPLPISDKPSPGWWSMSLGSPFGLENSISIGNIMNLLEGEVISTAPINPGNSGGPLVNSFGQVIGTNTWKLKDADGINVAKDVQLLCAELVNCNEPIWP
jgi:S1-C subfamily serine protease